MSAAGTTALVVDQDGQVVSRKVVQVRQFRPYPSWVEQDPEEIWYSVADTASGTERRPASARGPGRGRHHQPARDDGRPGAGYGPPAYVAGPAAVISWAVGGIFVIFISLTYAEQAGMLPRTGAIVRYPQLTHGAWTGWLIGWTYWLSAITAPAIEAEAVVTYVGSQAPGSKMETTSHGVAVLTWPNGILFFLGLMVLFFLLNFFGIRLMSETNRWVTWWKIIIPSITAIFMFTILRGANFTSLSFAGTGGFTRTAPGPSSRPCPPAASSSPTSVSGSTAV